MIVQCLCRLMVYATVPWPHVHAPQLCLYVSQLCLYVVLLERLPAMSKRAVHYMRCKVQSGMKPYLNAAKVHDH